MLNIAYPLAPVGPDAVGGAEQILTALDAALVRAGHHSIVIACDGSTVEGELVALPRPSSPLTDESWCKAHDACRAAIREVLARERVDVVHMHGVDFHAYVPPPGPAVLVTLHLPVDWYPSHVFATTRPNTWLQCVSRAQRLTAPASAILLDEIENGVDLDRLQPAERHEGYAVALGRICAEKGQHLALDAATRAGVPLVLAGQVFAYPEHQTYFRDEVESRLHAPHRFVGPVVGEAKRRLIADAACAVVSSLVAETSSLVAMEALACGTPVVAFRRGALIDLVEHGVTGFLVDDVDGLARALAEVKTLDRARCREAAQLRCSGVRMCERYLARYQELAAESRPRATRPARLRAEVLDRASVVSVEQAWRELWDRAPEATVFQRPEWCLPWCEHLLDGDVQALAVWRGSSLHAFLPLFCWRDGDAHVLSLIGAGMSDYSDALLAAEADAALAVLADTVRSLPWDRIELSEVPERSQLLKIAPSPTDEIVDQACCPGLAVSSAEPLAAVPAAMRREIDYQRRRAQRELGLEHVHLRADQAVDALTSLHRARWSLRGEAGVLDARRSRFLHAAAARLAQRDVLLGVGVRLGAELAAVALTFLDRGCARYYLGGFAPGHERRSPGTLAIAAAIEQASERGATWFDFLRGGEPYKYRFGARDRVRLRRRVMYRP